jgi:hypothetical protein
MRSLFSTVCWLFAACEPVLLSGDEPQAGAAAPLPSASASADAGSDSAQLPVSPAAGSLATSKPATEQDRDAATPRVLITVTPHNCGRCFELRADAAGGLPPYAYEWDDGSQDPLRHVCVGSNPLGVSVVVQDAAAARSAPTAARLIAGDDAGRCMSSAQRQPRLCLMNPSFEGTAAVNLGKNFDAVPWSACSNSADANTPDLVNDSLDLMSGLAPKPINGVTYVALSKGEQVSQALCEPLLPGDAVSLQLDLTRINLAPGDTTHVFLEIFGGHAADCSQHQLLWASPPLQSGWTRYCIKLRAVDGMDAILLQAQTDTDSLVRQYLAVDNLVPLDACP